MRVLAKASDNAVWATPTDTYRLEKWTIDGELEQSLTREISEEDGWGPVANWAFQDMRVDTAGRIWLLGSLYKDRWMPTTRPPSPEEIDAHVDTVIESVDVTTKSLWTSSVTPRALVAWIGDSSLTYSHERRRTNRIAVVVWRVQTQEDRR